MTGQTPETPRGWTPDAVAVAMIAGGAMVFALCGSCTGYFAGAVLWNAIAHGRTGGLFVVGVAAVIGGIPAMGGIVLIIIGIGRGRGRKPRASAMPPRPPPSSVPPPG
ncbi:MAG: hypothetical protein ACXU8S_06160 [Phenylobacterium sp.]